MKRTILFVAAIAMSVVAKAWEVGDFYANDPTGVPAIVVYVDESGEHGLIMSPKAYTEKGYKGDLKAFSRNKKYAENYIAKKIKLAKENGDQEEMTRLENLQAEQAANFSQLTDWLTTAPRIPILGDNITLKEKYEQRKILEEFSSQTNEYGEDNQKSVLAYCHENDINMTKYFCEYEYAINLGDGWFIPGNYELELYSKLYVEEMGRTHHISTPQKLSKEQFLREKLGAVGHWDTFFFPSNLIQSSTMFRSAWTESPENKEKMDMLTASSNEGYGSFIYSFAYQGITGFYWLVFASSVPNNSYIVAFKHF